MKDNLLEEKISGRYSKETENQGLGCADLVPYFDNYSTPFIAIDQRFSESIAGLAK